jgi:hypothetical protein
MTDVSSLEFIRSRGLNHRQFKAILEKIESEYVESLQRLVFLLEEIKISLIE